MRRSNYQSFPSWNIHFILTEVDIYSGPSFPIPVLISAQLCVNLQNDLFTILISYITYNILLTNEHAFQKQTKLSKELTPMKLTTIILFRIIEDIFSSVVKLLPNAAKIDSGKQNKS